MEEDNINDLKDVLFNLEIEGTYFYQDEENKDDYFIANKLFVIVSDQDYEDCEGEISFHLKSEMSDDYLLFTYVGENAEPHRIIGLPEIEYFEFENGVGTLLEKTNIADAVEFLKNLKTINFKELISENLYNKKNFKNVKSKKSEEADSNKTIVVKTFHENGKIKEEIETVNGKLHGLYKLYFDNGQLRVVTRYENGIQLDGIVDSYDENGFLIRTVELRNGKLNGPYKEFYSSGLIKKEGEYKDDEIIGKPVEYFEDGGIKDVSEENLKLNLSNMRLIIKELKVETVLVDFVDNWNKNNLSEKYYELEIDTINDNLSRGRDYYKEFLSIEIDIENNCLNLLFFDSRQVFPIISRIYNNSYLLITKCIHRITSNDLNYNEDLVNEDEVDVDDVHEYENEGNKLEYTIFEAEDCLGYHNQIQFKGGENICKFLISETDEDSYEWELVEFYSTKYFQDFYFDHFFISKKEFEDGNWFQTIKSFDLYDWDTYPKKF